MLPSGSRDTIPTATGPSEIGPHATGTSSIYPTMEWRLATPATCLAEPGHIGHFRHMPRRTRPLPPHAFPTSLEPPQLYSELGVGTTTDVRTYEYDTFGRLLLGDHDLALHHITVVYTWTCSWE